jgi:multidrug resistance efflux pump
MADGSPGTEVPTTPEGEPIPAPFGRTLLALSLALGLGTGLCWCLKDKAFDPESGTISGRPTSLLSQRTGQVELYWVKAGDMVQAGDPIAILVDEELLLEIDRESRAFLELQQALLRAEESLNQRLAKELAVLDAEIVSLKTQARLVSTGGSSSAAHLEMLEARRLDAAHQVRADLGIDRLRDNVLRAEVKLDVLKSQPRKITVAAAQAGTVKHLLRKPGERVTPGTPLIELANQSQPYLVVEMPEPLAKRFALGDEIPLSFPGQEKSVGRVANMLRLEPEIAYEPNASKPVAHVRVEIEPADESWPELPLESTVTVRTADSNALSRRVN